MYNYNNVNQLHLAGIIRSHNWSKLFLANDTHLRPENCLRTFKSFLLSCTPEKMG